MPATAIVIGLPETCRRLARQLQLLEEPPTLLGCILTPGSADESGVDVPLLGRLEDLDAVVCRLRPDLALVSLPAAMAGLVTSLRTRLRRLGVADRFMPTIEDQLAGVGPRSVLDVDLRALLDRPPRALDETALRRAVSGRRVLITGAGGSIGSELSRIAAQYRPAHLSLVERSENALFEIDRQVARFHPDVPRTALLHDVVDAPGTLAQFRRLEPEVIFHAAAHKHVPMMEDHPAAAVDNNFFGTASVAGAAAAVGAERFVMISTDKAVRPKSVMGATKRLAEMYVQHRSAQSATLCSMVRFGNVLGSSGSVLDTWSRQLVEGGPLTVTHPAMTRYFMTVAEAAALVVQSSVLVERASSGAIFVLDMGRPLRVLDLARRFALLHGLEPVVGDGPGPREGPGHVRIVFTGPRPGEKLHEQLAVDARAIRPTAHPDIHCLEMTRPDPDDIGRLVERLAPQRRPATAAALSELVRGLAAPRGEPVAA